MTSSSLTELIGNEIATALIPTTVTLVTTRTPEGEIKVATIAWAMPISHDPSLIAVAIRPQGQTARAIGVSGCFVVNVLAASDEAVRIASICGKKQGVEDRIDEAGLSLSEGLKVLAPRVDQAISWIECELVESRVYGDHELFIGRTLSATTQGELDEEGKLVPLDALLMGQRACFGHFEEGF